MRGWSLALAVAILAFVAGVWLFVGLVQPKRPFSTTEWARNIEARRSMVDGAMRAVPQGTSKRDVGSWLGTPDEVLYDKTKAATGAPVPITTRYRLGEGSWLEVEFDEKGKVRAIRVR